MKRPKVLIFKIFVSVILIFSAAGISTLIKETIDSSSPDSTLPLINVSAGYTNLDVKRAHFEWNYITRTVCGPSLSPGDDGLQLNVIDVEPAIPLIVTMSDSNYIDMKISRADALDTEVFYEVTGDEILTPSTSGVYVYKFEVGYKKGSLLFYTAVRVRETTLLK